MLLPCKLQKFDMGTLNPLWFFVKKSMTVALFGITISDRFATVYSLTGTSMSPTFTTSSPGFPGYLKGDIVLVEKFCLEKYKFSRGDVIAFKSPSDHKREFVKRLIALPGDWMQISDTSDILKIPEGHCWVEGDNKEFSLDSRHFGPIPLGLVQGRVTHIIWPPQRISKVERKVAMERVRST
ncbi:Mitochondrial inner membrane protease subunit [Musa troglodytarum]|uniref:Mitochondrial inner membrane protease subunit 2 n=1 Tax=Musa troglodytarum TaxID=320322 RepID=A0A9E7JLQ0_9LILI|nr:Mitochondrial inner membrane protease subunit [Musa troglodytarum]